MNHREPRKVWVDLGDGTIPMSVIDLPPQVWKNKVTGHFVPPEHWRRFKEFAEVLKPEPQEPSGAF